MSLCQSIDTLAMAFLDDELAAEERRELELHLIDCGSCRRHVDTERAELQLVRKALAPPPAPELFKARLAQALDHQDREVSRQERERARSRVGRWLLPGSAMIAAAAAIVAFVAIKPQSAPKSGAVVEEVVRQNARERPLEVRGASTRSWLRENFAPIEPPAFRTPRVEAPLEGARLTVVEGHDAAVVSYLISSGNTQFVLNGWMIIDVPDEALMGGTAIRVGDRTLHVYQTPDGIAAVTYVDEHHMGYVFATKRLTAQELFELVVSSDLIGRAQQGR